MKKLKYFACLLLFVHLLPSCHKERSEDSILDSAPQEATVAQARSIYPDTFRLQSPHFDQLEAFGREMAASWTEEGFLDMAHTYGAPRWEQAYLLFESTDQEDYLLSIPFRKGAHIQGLIFNQYLEGQHRFKFVPASELSKTVEELIDAFGYNYAIMIASTFSAHQFFYNGQNEVFESKLIELLETSVAESRCFYWKRECFEQYGTFPNGDETESTWVCYWALRWGGCTGNQDVFFLNGSFPDNTGNGGGSTGSSGVEDIDKRTKINWHPKGDCETKMLPFTDAQIRDMKLFFPCEQRTTDEIITSIMDRLCLETDAEKEHLTLADLEQELEKYDYVDLKDFSKNPREFLEDYVDAVCNCPESEEDCETVRILDGCDASIFPNIEQVVNFFNNLNAVGTLNEVAGGMNCQDVEELFDEESSCNFRMGNNITLGTANDQQTIGQILLGMRAARAMNCLTPCNSMDMNHVFSNFPFGLQGGTLYESEITINNVQIPIKIDLTANSPIQFSHGGQGVITIGQEKWYKLIYYKEFTDIPAMTIFVPLDMLPMLDSSKSFSNPCN